MPGMRRPNCTSPRRSRRSTLLASQVPPGVKRDPVRIASNNFNQNQIEMKHGKTQELAPSGKLRVGIVGAGQMARQHARAIARLDSAELCAVVDPDPVALAEILQPHSTATGFSSFD